jgi:urease accessory protein
MRSKIISTLCLFLGTLFVCGTALAHPGHGADNSGFMDGISHPLFGMDHMLAMIAVGVWAYQLGGRAAWLVPASFVSIMACAGFMGMAGWHLPMVEGGIALSLLVIGLLVAFSVTVTPAAGGIIVALFAVFHGYAHGTEMPAMTTPWIYAAGFVVATALLHGAGYVMARHVDKQGIISRIAGALVAATGVWMLAMN